MPKTRGAKRRIPPPRIRSTHRSSQRDKPAAVGPAVPSPIVAPTATTTTTTTNDDDDDNDDDVHGVLHTPIASSASAWERLRVTAGRGATAVRNTAAGVVQAWSTVWRAAVCAARYVAKDLRSTPLRSWANRAALCAGAWLATDIILAVFTSKSILARMARATSAFVTSTWLWGVTGSPLLSLLVAVVTAIASAARWFATLPPVNILTCVLSWPLWLASLPFVYTFRGFVGAFSATNAVGYTAFSVLCWLDVLAAHAPVSVWTAVRLAAAATLLYSVHNIYNGWKFMTWPHRRRAVLSALTMVAPSYVGYFLAYDHALDCVWFTLCRAYRFVKSFGADDSFMAALKERPAPPMADYVDRDAYTKAMAGLTVRPCGTVGAGHRYSHHSKCGDLRRVMREARNMRKSLPVEPGSSIFVRYDKSRAYLLRAIITGPPNTPYDSGIFVFDIGCGPLYPNSAPDVNIVSTDGGRVRFNPNLYSSGKVCLSLLGTWAGMGCERWSEDSTLLQVLVSIQGLILGVACPYFNEPGMGAGRTTRSARIVDNVRAHTNGGIEPLREATVRVAMLQMMESPPPGFEDVVRRHFVLKGDYAVATVEGWVAAAERRGGKSKPHMDRLQALLAQLKTKVAALKASYTWPDAGAAHGETQAGGAVTPTPAPQL